MTQALAQVLKPAKFKMPVEKVLARQHVHVPADLLELHEVLEFKEAKRNPQHPAHRNHLLRTKRAKAINNVFAGVFPHGGSPVITRAQWGARAPKGAYGSITPQNGGVALHYEGPKMGSYSHDACASKVRGIQNYHMDHNGWLDIAYSAIVCPHGYIFQGRWWHNRTAANGTNDSNQNWYAICGMWGDGDLLTDDARGAYLDGIALARSAGGAAGGIQPHQHFFNTSCPGKPVLDWIAAGVPAPPGYLNGPTPPPPPPSVGRIANVVAIIDNPAGDGGWLVAADGGIFTIPGAQFLGSMGGHALNAPIVGGLATPTGRGYWLFGADGGVFAFGDAPFRGTYGALAQEYATGQRAIKGAVMAGVAADLSTWRYTLVSDRLETYMI